MGKSIFEDPALIDANFGPNPTPNSPPEKWGDALRILAPKIRRIHLRWKRSNAQKKFDDLAGGKWEIDELDPKEKAEDRSDDRHDNVEKWAKEWAIKLWAFGRDHADRNGAGIAQMGLEGWGDSGYHPLKGGTLAAKCGDSTGAEEMELSDMGTSRVLTWMIVQLQNRLDKQDARLDSYALNIDKPIEALGKSVTAATELHTSALKLKEQSSESAAKERQAEREFLLNAMRINQSGENWGKAIDKLGPLLETIMDEVLFVDPNKPNYKKVAKVLRESITEAQIEKAKALGCGDLVGDIQSAMRALEKAKDDEEATAIIVPLARKVIPAQTVLQQVLTGEQLQLALSLFKFATVDQ